jgi:hypothetical protein
MVKVVVFDLDETIGNFIQLSVLDYKLRKYYNRDLSKDHFFQILDMFPKVFRPNIFNIFKYLKKMKEQKKIKIMIYTNNNGCKMWVHRIKSYVEKKLDCKLFDRVICAWKYDGKILEKNRTGYEKKYNDLLKCGHLKKTDEIIFLDDQLHEKMLHPQLTYLYLKPYHYNYSDNAIISTYVQHMKLKRAKALQFKKYFNTKTFSDHYTYKTISKNESFDIKGKKIERHIRRFIESSNKSTRKHRQKKNKTLKKSREKKIFKV